MGDETEHSDFVQKLIDAVRKYRCLYDKKHIAYFNRQEREKAWRHIGQQLGRRDTDCHKRWKLLREKLAKELKKRDRALTNGEQFHSNWACFRKIMFVEDHIAPRRKYEKVECVISTNLSKKRISPDSHFKAYDLTKKRPNSANDLNFLVQLSRASTSRNSDLFGVYESDTISEVKTELEDRENDEINNSSFIKEEEGDLNSRISSLTSRSQTPEMLDLTRVVDRLLQDLRHKKANDQDLNDLNAFQFEQKPFPIVDNLRKSDEIDNISEHNLEKDFNSITFINHDNATELLDNKIDVKTPEHNSETSDLFKKVLSESIKSETNNDNIKQIRKLEFHNKTSKYQPNEYNLHFIKEKDILFGRLVTIMLADISIDEDKDDAKCNIMQLLVNAKRASNSKMQKLPESST